ncbi:hypothetical protein [Mycoplasmopsis columboralis]|uniref:DUF3899 domain-containing protein n=1 Tax=Mycoplasmopsis columboralis TaxID=171282 RepID=A0A449B5U2_9BACT|nr:hypothetical protein [Mycoplasmopsis columboralis]VEU75888.1 Uncharacterised protein [Mycoplasmopsis columboralis]
MNLTVYIVFSILFFILGILFIFLYRYYSPRAISNFKEKQLQEYRKNNPQKKHLRYEQTGLYLPSWERMKYNSPIFGAVVSFIIFISLFVKIFV